MKSISLFDDKVRTLEGPADNNITDIFKYYNDSARPEVDNVRILLESWFSQYPDEEKQDLKSRFKASFDPTFYELFIYILFKRLGYCLTIHPELPNTRRHPDYLAKRGDEILYIEVKHMTMHSTSTQSLERRKNTVLASINKVNSSNFLLNLKSVIFKNDSQPSGKRIIYFFNQEISKYDADLYTSSLRQNRLRKMPKITYNDEKVTIEVQLLPKLPEYRGVKSRAIAIYPSETQIGNDSKDIFGALVTKGTRYGNLNAPYIICINKQGVSLDITEIQEALYGSLQTSWSRDSPNRNDRLEFAGNGFFGSKHTPKSTRVSGVYITNANTANLGTTAAHAFRRNPFAKYPIDLTIADSIKELLGIPDNYPFNHKCQ